MKKPLARFYDRCVRLLRGSGIGRFYPVILLDHLIVKLLKSSQVTIDGHTLALDQQDSLRLSIHGLHEPLETAAIKECLKENSVVVDIGANIGYYTLLMARAVGPRGHVFAFEPEPANFSLLRKNLQLNGYANVTAEQAALSDQPGVLRLYLCGHNKGDHRMYDSGDRRMSVEIKALRLDDYLKDRAPAVDFLKIDVQGAEALAFEGMKRTIGTGRSMVIATEFWPAGIRKSGKDPCEYIRALQELGFVFYSMHEEKRCLRAETAETVLAAYTAEKDNCANLLCVRGDDVVQKSPFLRSALSQ